ncbi:MAG: hypothetical protein HZA60_02865 [Deltaproteobacteria bacterium]|nr:hypothetical protein [Deltaproteobacteria bacterium]
MKVPKGLYFHPMFVHFPQALFPVAFAMFLLYLATGAASLEQGVYLVSAFGLVAAPVTTITGFLDWKIRYKGYMTRVFKIKIVAAFTLIALALCAVLLRTYVPVVAALPLSGLGWLYGALLAGCVGTCVVSGYYGGKLVFH